MRLPWDDGPFVVPEGTPGAVMIIGRLYDGAGNIIPDGLIETWQAGPDGRIAHPDDPRGPTPGGYHTFRGFGRCPTASDGSFRIVTLKPGPLPTPGVFARHNAVDTPALLPDGTAAESSVSRVLAARGTVRSAPAMADDIAGIEKQLGQAPHAGRDQSAPASTEEEAPAT